MLSLVVGLYSCNKESVKLSVQLNRMESSVAELKLISKNGQEQIIQSSIEIEDDGFDTYLDNVKPPCKISMVIDGEKEYQFWLFRYGKYHVQINKNDSVEICDCMENAEYDRIINGYYKMYLAPLEAEIKWVKEKEQHEKLSQDEEFMLFDYKKEISKAYRLRKKSVLSTFRKNPQNRIAIALLFDEYERLTSWQKEECLKTAQKYYSDCGINWQLRN